jgi:hypothetical protein
MIAQEDPIMEESKIKGEQEIVYQMEFQFKVLITAVEDPKLALIKVN